MLDVKIITKKSLKVVFSEMSNTWQAARSQSAITSLSTVLFLLSHRQDFFLSFLLSFLLVAPYRHRIVWKRKLYLAF